MLKPVEVRALDGYRLWLRYADDTEGEVNLSHLAGKGVFKVWADRDIFAAVQIGARGALEWPGDIDLCPDALYLPPAIIAGSLPPRATGMVAEWASLHQRELMTAWQSATHHEPVTKIDPLP